MSERLCINPSCRKPLVGYQRLYCSNACKQAVKYQNSVKTREQLEKENQRLQRKVKRLEKKLEALA